MIKSILYWLENYWVLIITIILALIGLACGGVSIYCFITYGNLPITEVPSWALPFMFGGRK